MTHAGVENDIIGQEVMVEVCQLVKGALPSNPLAKPAPLKGWPI